MYPMKIKLFIIALSLIITSCKTFYYSNLSFKKNIDNPYYVSVKVIPQYYEEKLFPVETYPTCQSKAPILVEYNNYMREFNNDKIYEYIKETRNYNLVLRKGQIHADKLNLFVRDTKPFESYIRKINETIYTERKCAKTSYGHDSYEINMSVIDLIDATTSQFINKNLFTTKRIIIKFYDINSKISIANRKEVRIEILNPISIENQVDKFCEDIFLNTFPSTNNYKSDGVNYDFDRNICIEQIKSIIRNKILYPNGWIGSKPEQAPLCTEFKVIPRANTQIEVLIINDKIFPFELNIKAAVDGYNYFESNILIAENESTVEIYLTELGTKIRSKEKSQNYFKKH